VTGSFVHPRFTRNLNEQRARLADGSGRVRTNFAIFSVRPNCEEIDQCEHTPSRPTLLTDCQLAGQWHEFCEDVDQIMEGLVSPAPESFHVLHSVMSKINAKRECFSDNIPEVNVVRSLDDLRTLSSFLVKLKYAIELYIDTERLKWKLIPREKCNIALVHPWGCVQEGELELYHVSDPLQLSRMALDLATKTPNDPRSSCKIEDIAKQAQKRLALTMGSDLRGPTSSDTSFNFALAGVQHSSSLFQNLSCIGIHELNRSGHRSSFKPKNILHMVEKFAASDIHGHQALELYRVAGVCLEKKGYIDARLIHSLKDGSFGFHCDRPLIWLWRFSSRQKKVSLSGFLLKSNDGKNVNWDEIFDDTSKPLVCDVGSGMGASLLNLSVLASLDGSAKDKSNLDSDALQIPWSRCNYVGADLNRAMVRFGNGVISRDVARRSGRVHFLCFSAEDFLTELLFYPGGLSLIMINFPSPYRLDGAGNTQLPSKRSNQFMVTKKVLASIAELLDGKGAGGLFLFQTKCEDVAIHVKNECLSLGTMECVATQYPIEDIDLHYNKIGKRPKRVDEWLKDAQSAERAEGSTYSSTPLLPTAGRPETEVQCSHDNTVVHRVLFRRKFGTTDQ